MSTNPRSRSLLELPVDVMLCILDHAELHALFFLSQTCKTMQRLAKRDFRTMANTNVEGKVDFCAGITQSTIGAVGSATMFNTSTFNLP
jgi:hypothetical protein